MDTLKELMPHPQDVAAEFNTAHPLGSKVMAHVYPGLRECTVVGPARTLDDGNVAFRANYDKVHNAMVFVDWIETGKEATNG